MKSFGISLSLMVLAFTFSSFAAEAPIGATSQVGVSGEPAAKIYRELLKVGVIPYGTVGNMEIDVRNMNCSVAVVMRPQAHSEGGCTFIANNQEFKPRVNPERGQANASPLITSLAEAKLIRQEIEGVAGTIRMMTCRAVSGQPVTCAVAF